MFFLLPLLVDGLLLVGAAACGAVAVGSAVCMGLMAMQDLADALDELAAAEGAKQERVKARVAMHLEQCVQELRSLDVQHRRAELAQLEALLASKSLSADKRRWLNEQLARLRRELGE